MPSFSGNIKSELYNKNYMRSSDLKQKLMDNDKRNSVTLLATLMNFVQ